MAMSRAANPADFHRQAAFAPAPRASVPNASVPVATKRRKSLLRRIFEAMTWSRERQSQHDIDRVVSWRDGGFNDTFEREIAERFYSDGGNFRR
jgi:hypothetical protein